MTHYSRQNREQAAEADAVYAAMKRFTEGKPVPQGALQKSTGMKLPSILASLELLIAEEKVELVLKHEYKLK